MQLNIKSSVLRMFTHMIHCCMSCPHAHVGNPHVEKNSNRLHTRKGTSEIFNTLLYKKWSSNHVLTRSCLDHVPTLTPDVEMVRWKSSFCKNSQLSDFLLLQLIDISRWLFDVCWSVRTLFMTKIVKCLFRLLKKFVRLEKIYKFHL